MWYSSTVVATTSQTSAATEPSTVDDRIVAPSNLEVGTTSIGGCVCSTPSDSAWRAPDAVASRVARSCRAWSSVR